MKKYLISLVLFFSIASLLAQTPEEYIKQIPNIPSKLCSVTDENINTFQYGINDLINTIKKDIKNREAEFNSPEFKNKYMKKNLPGMSGMSEEDMKKMKNMSKEERKKMGMKLAEKYMNNPPTVTKQDYEEKKEMSDLSISMIDIDAGGYATKMKNIENDYLLVQTSADSFYKVNITPLNVELSKIPDGEGGTGPNDPDVIKYNALKKQISEQQIALCAKYSIEFKKVLDRHLKLYNEELPNLRRVEELKLKDFNTPNRDVLSLKELITYLEYYKESVKYRSF